MIVYPQHLTLPAQLQTAALSVKERLRHATGGMVARKPRSRVFAAGVSASPWPNSCWLVSDSRVRPQSSQNAYHFSPPVADWQ